MKRKLISPKHINVFFILQIASHFIIPITTFIHFPYSYLGIVLIIAGIILNIYSTFYMSAQNTSINFHNEPKKLVVNGPFGITRNPIYLSGVVVSFGITILLGSVISLLITIAFFAILNQIYVPSEEIILENKFGNEFKYYKQRVRRWI